MKITLRERRDLFLLALLVLLGVLLMLIAGQFAVRLLPRWNVPSDMDSRLNLEVEIPQNSSFSIAPLRPEILTPPSWGLSFLTPGVDDLAPVNVVPVVILGNTTTPVFGTTSTNTNTPAATATLADSATPTEFPTLTPFPTNTLVYVFPTITNTPIKPANTATFTPIPPTFTPSSTFTQTLTPSLTPSETFTPTETLTPTFTFTPIATDVTPPEIGTTPDTNIYELPDGSSLTLGMTIIVNGHAGPDLVLYERVNGSGINMDAINLLISQDGHTWYTIFYWGDGLADTNSNLNIAGPLGGTEFDDRDIDASFLYPTGTYGDAGVTMDLDMVVPAGTYYYLRITAPVVGGDGICDIDAIEILP